MTMRITMIQSRLGEAGSVLAAGTTNTVSDAFGAAMVGAGYATDTDLALKPGNSNYDATTAAGVQALVSDAEKTAGAVGLGGTAVTSPIGVKAAYGYMDSGGHTVQRNYHFQTVLETDFDEVQIGLFNSLAVPITGVRVAVGVAATLGADGSANTYTADTWADPTWAGAATVNQPAGAAQRPSLVLSDWQPLASVARADGGLFPILHVRLFVGSANANVPKVSPSGLMAWMRSEAETAGRVWRVMNQDGGDYVVSGGRATFNATADASRWYPILIRYKARNGAVTTVFVVGDSIASGVGATNYLESHFWRARERMSSARQPVELAHLGWAGQTMPNSAGRAQDLIAAGVIGSGNVLALGAFSPNDFTTAVTTEGIAAMRVALSSVVAAASGAGVSLLLQDGAPVNPASKDWNATDSLRVAWNAEIKATYPALPLIGLAATLSAAAADGDGQIGYLSGLTTDNLHPNELGTEVLVPGTVTAVNTYSRWRTANYALTEVIAGQVAGIFNPDGTITRFTMQALQYVGNANSQFFTVPDGVTVIEMEGVGSGGGGGGGFASANGGGGGAGSGGQVLYRKPFVVKPGETLTINVPFGGAAGAAGANAGRPVPDGPSGSVLNVTGSLSGQLVSLTAGGPGRAGTATVGGQGGDASGARFNTGVAAPAAGTAGTPGTDFLTENSNYGNTGGMGGTGCCSTGTIISGGRGGRSNNVVQGGVGGATGAVSGQGGGGGGGTGFPDQSSGTGASGGNGGADAVAGQVAQNFGAGGGGGGRNAAGGAGGTGMLRIYY